LNGSNLCGSLQLRDSGNNEKEEPFVSSVLRKVGRGKAKQLDRNVQVVRREQYDGMELDSRVGLIQDLVAIAMMQVGEMFHREVAELAGSRYERKEDGSRGYRHGENPGSIRLGGQRVPVRVPRVRDENGEIPLESYQKLRGSPGELDEKLFQRVLYGISCRNYEKAAESIPGAIGLSSSSVSRSFIATSAAQLKAFQERDLSGEDYVALFLDGKSFADTMMVVALGITIDGRKQPLGFVETTTENKRTLAEFLRSLMARGLDVSEGILVVIDGAKGLRAAVREAFPRRAVVGRCNWHKRENVVSYLPKGEQATWRKRLQKALDRPTHKEAETALMKLHQELEEKNQSAAASLLEGLAEVLTLHRLGVFGLLGRSFKTTNCLENINGLIAERCAKVDCWKNSSQRQRWMAAALLDIEPRLRRVIGHRHLPKLREALKRELKIETGTAEKKAAA
jgi:putative transposase